MKVNHIQRDVQVHWWKSQDIQERPENIRIDSLCGFNLGIDQNCSGITSEGENVMILKNKNGRKEAASPQEKQKEIYE